MITTTEPMIRHFNAPPTFQACGGRTPLVHCRGSNRERGMAYADVFIYDPETVFVRLWDQTARMLYTLYDVYSPPMFNG